MTHPALRIALLYDCLYPYTVGGAERWYASLAERLARRHQVTYVTRHQWERGHAPTCPEGVRVAAVSGGRDLYTPSGRRRIWTPLRFGWGVFWHLLRHRRDYDVIHTCSFPFFSLLAARLACAGGGPPVVTDWLEVWSRQYWSDYLGPVGGAVGAAVQRLCVRFTGPACVLSNLHALRLQEEGYRGRPMVLGGLYAEPVVATGTQSVRDPLVVYVGRHIREKRVASIPAAIAEARQRIPALRATIFGDGPERPCVLGEIERLGLSDVVCCPGFAPWEKIDSTLRRAMCLLLPSRREGYGLVVVEAAARGTPSIVVRDIDNAAGELIVSGVNGLVVESAAPHVLADAIVAIQAQGADLPRRTQEWFACNAQRLNIDSTIEQLETVYARVTNGRRVARVDTARASAGL